MHMLYKNSRGYYTLTLKSKCNITYILHVSPNTGPFEKAEHGANGNVGAERLDRQPPILGQQDQLSSQTNRLCVVAVR